MLYYLRDNPEAEENEGPVLAAFFEAVTDVLVTKTLRAAKRLAPKSITACAPW